MTAMSEPLFDGFDPPTTQDLYSAGQRRTARQRDNAARGWHPLMGTRTHPDLGTCGDCRFRMLLDHHGKRYPKCVNEHAPISHGEGTDVRAWWPACQYHVLGEPKLSADAARWKP